MEIDSLPRSRICFHLWVSFERRVFGLFSFLFALGSVWLSPLAALELHNCVGQSCASV
jgi:hypothetical protein